jgi:hypothetical protein
MNLAISGATAHHAEKIQADHHRDEDGLCWFCRRHFDMAIPFGRCKPYQLAQGFINTLVRQQERFVARPPVPKIELARPGGRVWPAET